jgi:Arc/MetJ-type ribon-helix-helix transcriptional regulator
MSSLAIHLPDDLKAFVDRSIQSGAYEDTDAFFASVLSTFKEQIETPLTATEETSLSLLREDVNIATRQIDQGQGITDFDWDAFLDERHRHFALNNHP